MNADQDDLIRPDEIKVALQASGYLLEGRIAEVLESKGFYVELNSFRSDPRDESKSIEIDVWGRFGETVNPANDSVVVVEPLIECKNNSQSVAFFVKRQPVPELNDNHIKYAGFPISSADPKTQLDFPLHKLLGMKDWHHYCQVPQVATQFCSFTRNLAEKKEKKIRNDNREQWCWKSEPMENYSKSFSALCIAAEHAGIGGFKPERDNIELEFYYPIVVFQGPIYEVTVSGAAIHVTRSDHLQLHHSASVGGRVIQTQVDVVSEQGFPVLIDTIQAELKSTVTGIQLHEQALFASAVQQKQADRKRQNRAKETETDRIRRQFEAYLKGPRNMAKADDITWAYNNLNLLRDLMQEHSWLCDPEPNRHLFDTFLMRLPQTVPSLGEQYVLQIAEASRKAIIP